MDFAIAELMAPWVKPYYFTCDNVNNNIVDIITGLLKTNCLGGGGLHKKIFFFLLTKALVVFSLYLSILLLYVLCNHRFGSG